MINKAEPRLFCFNSLECCSLDIACKSNGEKFDELLWIFFGKIDERTRLMGNIFDKSLALACPLDNTLRNFYIEIAKTELGRLGSVREELPCGHSADDHIRSIKDLIKRLNSFTTQN